MMDTTPLPPARALSPRLLGHAPHRLMFFVGACNLLLAMAWWTAWLATTRWPQLGLHQPQPYAGWLHAFVMQYQVLPSFFFGFLLTVFPRWLRLPSLPLWRYLPVGLGLFGGQLVTLLGALGWQAGVGLGALLTVAGWSAGLLALGPLLWCDTSGNWHARSCFTALLLGLAGLLAWTVFVYGGPHACLLASIKLGTFGLLLPVYITVAHRMFPFFAGNVVPGYRPWRPLWLLAALWALLVLRLALLLAHADPWLWLADLPLLALAGLMLWRWWPRGPKPGLLTVLFLGLAWLPVTFALYAAQDLALQAGHGLVLGRAPAHALFVGFFGSVLIAMVTRVTQGHAGRALVMPRVAWYAFVMIQLVTLTRVVAELLPDTMFWQTVAAAGWLLAFVPWVARIGRIYLAPRADGKPG